MILTLTLAVIKALVLYFTLCLLCLAYWAKAEKLDLVSDFRAKPDWLDRILIAALGPALLVCAFLAGSWAECKGVGRELWAVTFGSGEKPADD